MNDSFSRLQKSIGSMLSKIVPLFLFSLFFLPNAFAADNTLTSIVLQDPNTNGKINQVTVTVTNDSANTAAIHDNTGWAVTQGGSDISITGVAFSGNANATPLVIVLTLDESDGDLTSDTAATNFDVTYTQQGVDAGTEYNDGANTQLLTIGTGESETDGAAPIYTVAGTSVNAAGDTIALTFTEAMDVTTITNAILQADTNVTLDYSDDAGNTNQANITVTNATVAWTVGNTIATITLNEGTDAAYIPSGKFVGVTLASVTDVIGNAEAGAERYTTSGVTAETTAPTVTKLGNNTIDYTILPTATVDLVFNEVPSAASKAVIQAAITAGATDTPASYSWSDATLTIEGHATKVIFFNDDVSAIATDLVGNASSSALLLIDSLVEGSSASIIANQTCIAPTLSNFGSSEAGEISFEIVPNQNSAIWSNFTTAKSLMAVTIDGEEVGDGDINLRYGVGSLIAEIATTKTGTVSLFVSAPSKIGAKTCYTEETHSVILGGGTVSTTDTSSETEEEVSTTEEETTSQSETVPVRVRERRQSSAMEKVQAFETGTPKRFSDVSSSGWSAGYISDVSAANLMTGYDDGSNNFGPMDKLTTAQTLAVSLRLFGYDIPNNVAGDWSAPYLKSAKDAGIAVRGETHGIISRAEAVYLLARSAEVDLSEYEGMGTGFSDVPSRADYVPAIAWAVDNGIVSGYEQRGTNGGKLFGPNDPLTREQFAKMAVEAAKVVAD